MIMRVLLLAMACLVLAAPGEARAQSLLVELGIVSMNDAAEQGAVAEGTRYAQVRRGRTTYANESNLGGAVRGDEEAEEDTAQQTPRPPRNSGNQVAFGGLFSFGGGAVPNQFRRQTVRYDTDQRPGTIIIDTSNRFLYHIGQNGMATRYGVGVGRQGFGWKGTAYVGTKREWPDWYPPASMRAREPWLPARMAGGPENPLGARALYLYQGGADTLYRIHGTNQPESIGQALSSGCIRMMNEDVIHLYTQVNTGTRVIVM